MNDAEIYDFDYAGFAKRLAEAMAPERPTALATRAGVRYLHRPANLEDLFIKLTGRELRD